MTPKTTRLIHLAIDVGPDGSDSWRLVAECDDEMTQVVVMNGTPAGLTRPEPSELRGELGRILVAFVAFPCRCDPWRLADMNEPGRLVFVHRPFDEDADSRATGDRPTPPPGGGTRPDTRELHTPTPDK
jgi:hypothetical protein